MSAFSYFVLFIAINLCNFKDDLIGKVLLVELFTYLTLAQL